MPKNKKEITLDDLATMIGNGFNDVNSRFKEVDKRFDTVDKRFDRLEGKVDNLEKDNARFKKEFAAIRFTLTELAYKDEVFKLEQRIERIEAKLGLV